MAFPFPSLLLSDSKCASLSLKSTLVGVAILAVTDEVMQPCMLQGIDSVALHLQGEYAPRQGILKPMEC